MSEYIIGKLIVAGDYPADEQIGGNPLARAVVVMPRDALKAVKRLPMYKDVAVVELEKVTTLERENAALREWVKEEGKRNDVCTYGILKEVCEDCKCSKRKEAQP